MGALRAGIKDLFYRAGLATWLDQLLFKMSGWKHAGKNKRYKAAHPGLVLPPDYFLYETYRLDYEAFVTDGRNTAMEVWQWTRSYLPARAVTVLDWGCGVSRLAVHLPELLPPSSHMHACDINADMIAFNKANYPGISYEHINQRPPLPYANQHFHLVYGLSIFTHIEANEQPAWLQEMHRVLQPQGIFFFTTHGTLFSGKLLERERKQLLADGRYSKRYVQQGHRMMSTYNDATAFAAALQPYFDIIAHYDGATHPSKAGGQDVWIVRRR